MPLLNLHARCCRLYPARCWSAALCSIQWFWNLVCLIWNTWPTVHNQQSQSARICCSIKEVDVTRLLWHYTLYFSSTSLISELQKWQTKRGFLIAQTCSEWRHVLILAWTNWGEARGCIFVANRKKCLHYPIRKVTIYCTNHCTTVIDKHNYKMVLRTWAQSQSCQLQRNLWTCSEQIPRS